MPISSQVSLPGPSEDVDSKEGRHRGPLPGCRVLPREVVRTINTCEKTPCRYLLSRPRFGTAWPPEHPGLQSIGRHRGPLPGGRVLPREVRSPLTFRGEPPADT